MSYEEFYETIKHLTLKEQAERVVDTKKRKIIIGFSADLIILWLGRSDAFNDEYKIKQNNNVYLKAVVAICSKLCHKKILKKYANTLKNYKDIDSFILDSKEALKIVMDAIKKMLTNGKNDLEVIGNEPLQEPTRNWIDISRAQDLDDYVNIEPVKKPDNKDFEIIFENFSKLLVQKSETFCLDNPRTSTNEQKNISKEKKRFKKIEEILKVVEAFHREDMLFEFLTNKFEISQELVSRLKEMWEDNGLLELAKENMNSETYNKLVLYIKQIIIRQRLNTIYNSNPDISLNSKRLHMLHVLKTEFNITDKEIALQILGEYDFNSRKIDVKKRTRRK